jgi:hypothetical protein
MTPFTTDDYTLTFTIRNFDSSSQEVIAVAAPVYCQAYARPTGTLKVYFEELRRVDCGTGALLEDYGQSTKAVSMSKSADLYGSDTPALRIRLFVCVPTAADDWANCNGTALRDATVEYGQAVYFEYIITNPGTEDLLNPSLTFDMGTPATTIDDQDWLKSNIYYSQRAVIRREIIYFYEVGSFTGTLSGSGEDAAAALYTDSDAVTFTVTAPAGVVSVLVNVQVTSLLSSFPIAAFVQCSVDVQNFVVGDITCTNGSPTNFVATSPSRYDFEITPYGDDVDMICWIEQGVFDAGGIGNDRSNDLQITFDALGPLPVTTSDNGKIITDITPVPFTVTTEEV